METKRFQRREEDFTCENCHSTVKGDGYTNHCPVCLYSKHVDANPGDREAECGGIMEPVDVLVKAGEYILVHKCGRCGVTRKNRTAKGDDFNRMLAVMRSK